MKVKLFHNQGTWDIMALEEPFHGEELGNVECAGLKRVHLLPNGTITAGEIRATHGAMFNDVVYQHPQLVRDMGINRTFLPCERQAVYDINQACWIERENGRRVDYAKFVTVLRGYVYFSNELPYHNKETQSKMQALPQPEPLNQIDNTQQNNFGSDNRSWVDRLLRR